MKGSDNDRPQNSVHLVNLALHFDEHGIKASFVCPDFNDMEVDGVSKLPLLLNTTNASAEEHWTVIAVWL